MRTSRTSLTLGLILVCAALTLSLAVHARGQTVTFLAQFQGAQISARGVTQATDGNFYGTTEFGGAHDKGQLFRMTPSGELTTVYSFCSQSGCADGSYPTSAPVVGGDGNL